MHIKSLEVTSNFKYLWLKSVEGVDLNNHCARCLIGEYDSRINSTIKKLDNIVLSSNIYYLCGVAFPFDYNKNFHLAFIKKQGNSISFSSNGIDIQIEDAEMLPISPEYIDPFNPKAKYKSYSTCRNWQFANYLKSTDLI